MTADASAIVAAFAPWHEDHRLAAPRTDGIHDLAADGELEAYSVLTRLPAELRVPGGVGSEYLAEQFPRERLVLPADQRVALTCRLAGRGVTGGRVYDELIALTAAAHGQVLLTCDRCAEPTYRRLGVETELL